MDSLLIAVALTEKGKISPHAGRAETWRVYACDQEVPEYVWSLHLTSAGSLHEWHVRGTGNKHPLHRVDIAIAGSAGEGVTRRLKERDTQLVTTTEQDPLMAVEAFLANQLTAGDEADCLNPAQRDARQNQ